jgi:pyridoxamine 5'-phosphate oxidase
VTGSSNASRCSVPPPFLESEARADPIEQFRVWYEAALKCDCAEPTAMTVATATGDGKPSARVVLLKHYDHRGFVFFTNYESRKGRELAQNPRAALLFYWDSLRRQIRIEGKIEVLPAADSDKYFASRSYESQISAWASPQSQAVVSRQVLLDRCQELSIEYRPGAVPRPPHWGGYRVLPETIEFWQGGQGRLHDRLCYVRTPTASWRLERLAP